MGSDDITPPDISSNSMLGSQQFQNFTGNMGAGGLPIPPVLNGTAPSSATGAAASTGGGAALSTSGMTSS